VAPFLSWLG